MLAARIIPCLQLIDESLVKTVRFGKYDYIGDPCNTVRIFNELEVDELCFLDIRASLEGREPNLQILRDIADECFMPLSYGGGIRSFEVGKQILSIGFEKLVLNTHPTLHDKSLVTKLSEHFGAQAIVGSIDVRKNSFGKYQVITNDGTKPTALDAVAWAQELESLGAGELLLTSIDRDGTWEGFDLDITRRVADSVGIPVIANGGAGCVAHIGAAVREGHASAVALGSMVVYQKKGCGVLVNFPERSELGAAFSSTVRLLNLEGLVNVAPSVVQRLSDRLSIL
ncbi:MAG: AglZ/HisF2 family acetamidino modification protein [Saprospiraceae bacterium]